MAGWSEELVWIDTDDKVRHDGVVIRPTGGATGTAVVWMHGASGRFSEPHTITIGRYLAGRGHLFVSGNNRGHHFGASLGSGSDGKPRLGGFWWERLSEAWLDIDGWLDFAETLGAARLILAGHSYGAAKVVLYQGERQDPRVAGLISASGPSGPNWLPGRRPELTPEPLALAKQMVAEGRGLDLLPFGATGRPGQSSSAQTIVERDQTLVDIYGVETGDSPLAKVRCPLLAILGSEEPQLGPASDLEMIRRNATGSPRVETALIQGADHVYTTTAEDVARAVDRFLVRLT